MTWRVRVRLPAELDIQRAATWYEMERVGLGARFLDSIRSVFRALAESPTGYAEIEISPGLRRALAPRFPYSVYFQILDQDVVVLAVLHQRMGSAAVLRELGLD